ncbi:unnamed protein product [Clonostachys chloroleuca]|uniref:NmrA-like domain-containing protein n=1 Tax=Clonostachys chloroleuca TaxID=1926264 RepID=A0AA35M2G0_9HYPO|nr:unnamed protein product [Clonostachys chloroleuca]
MSSIKNVAVFGTGFLASALIPQLSKSGFNVTVLSRSASTKENPEGVVTGVVDYSSVDSLAKALQGQDVAIAALAMPALLVQTNIIEACIKAGVKRFIPSDFGALTTRPVTRDLPLNAHLNVIQDLLREKAAKGEIEYSIISPGMFLEYVLNLPLIIDLKGHSINLYDEGKHPFSTTSIQTISKAVVSVLKGSEATKNRVLYINDTTTTQADLLRFAKKHSPTGTEWKETALDAQVEFAKAIENAAKNPTDPAALFPVLQAAVLGGKHEAAYPEIDNELLGLPLLTSDELEAKVAAVVQATE